MSAVDVLAAWDELLAFASRGVERDDPAREMIEAGYEARTAMVELMEAATYTQEKLQRLNGFREVTLDAALSRCRGESQP